MKKILFVDDNSYQKLLISKILEIEKFEYKSCNNGQEALSLMETFSPDLLICDLLMPEMTGEELVIKLRGQGNEVPVIILTSDIQDTSKASFEKLNIEDFLLKPLERSEFLKAIEKVFQKENKN